MNDKNQERNLIHKYTELTMLQQLELYERNLIHKYTEQLEQIQCLVTQIDDNLVWYGAYTALTLNQYKFFKDDFKKLNNLIEQLMSKTINDCYEVE